MILARKNTYWYIAERANPQSSGCAIRVGANMPNEGGFGPPPGVGLYLVKQLESTAGLQFFPYVYYRGCRVWPEAWDRESEEPILRCLAMPNNFEDITSDYFRKIGKGIGAIYPGDVLRADGWEQIARGEYVKFFHVDDLEKIEGPPPEGVF